MGSVQAAFRFSAELVKGLLEMTRSHVGKPTKISKNWSEIRLNWSCDFCGKSGLVVSKAGVIYCSYCRKTYGGDKKNEMDSNK